MALLSCKQRRSWRYAGALAAALALCGPALVALADDKPVEDLDIFELSELSSQVYSAAKRSQPLGKTPAAAYVITREDIRRSGLTSIPELLRTVPGVNVQRIDSNFWSISIRGNVETYNRSLLVLVDGRSVYSPLFGGTYWDVQRMPLEDIERIEVIRGPGGAVWGANATNGVINIIRRAPAEQGDYLTTTVGSHDRVQTSFGHTASYGKDLKLLTSGYYTNLRQTYDHSSGSGAYDDMRFATLHARADLSASEHDFLRMQGDWYGGDRGNVSRMDTPASLLTGCDAQSSVPLCAGVPGYQVRETTDRIGGGNAMFGWEHRASEDSVARLDLFWDNTYRDSRFLEETRNTFDLEFRHTFKPLASDSLQWGGGARLLLDRSMGSFNFVIDNAREAEAIYSAFAEDELALFDGRLRVTAGSKVEYDTFSGFEIQPSARFALDAGDRHQIWGAFSRAVRTPARAERAGFTQTIAVFPGSPAQPITLRGSDDFESEVLLVSELGYRFQPTDWLHADLATFAGDYENVRDLTPTPGQSNPFDVTFTNFGEVKAYGGELSVSVHPAPAWKLRTSWTREHRRGDDPKFVATDQLAVLSYMELPGNLSFDTGLYYNGRIRVAERPPVIDIPGYWRLDLRLGWAPRPSFELELVAQDLNDRRHPEYGNLYIRAATPLQDLGTRYNDLPRAFYARGTWRF